MSKGTPRIAVRLPDDLTAEINRAVDNRNLWSAREPWTFSDFVRIACREKLAKMKRCRKKRAAKKRGVPAGFAAAGSPVAGVENCTVQISPHLW